MVDIVVAVAAKVAEYLVAPVGRQCGYVIFTNSYVGQLEKEREKLENARGRVQHLIDEDLKNMKLIEADVEKWVTDVETIANKARDVRENDGRAKKTCFYGWLPNPKIRYRLGREARTTVQTIRKLIQEGRFERVSYERAPPGLVGGAPNENSSACDGGDTIQELIARGQSENPPPGRAGDDGGDTIQELIAPGQFEKVELENCPPGLVGDASDVNLSVVDGGDTITDSRASIFQGIMKALDDKKLKVVGVYGPGGVGKTTLLKEVMKKLKKEGRPFHMIVKAEVSQTPDLNNIQGQIADALSLNLKDKESQQGRRDLLFQRLQRDPNEKVLIILDDLWAELDLEAIGIPLGDESMGCKLLLTSRDRSLLEQKMHTKPTFHLEGLKEDEAFRLFEYWVGNKLEYNEELKAKAAQVVRKLAGLPLLITSVASTLKCSGVSAWDNALIKIEDRNNEKIVKWSYDHLQYVDAKCLFLLCGLIGGTIEVELLLGLGMGLGLFEGYYERVQYSRNRLNQMLDSLHSFCLLQDGGNDKKSVNIHDLYSEAVMSTPFGDQNSLMMNNNCVSWSKEKLEKYWAISLVNVDSDRLAKLMRCVFPNLKILMLSQPENWRRRPAHRHDGGDCCRLDFTYMKELQVLYVRSMHIATLPSSIDILENLQSLYLVHCEVDDVAILGKLKALQILSFAGSTISRLPEEIGKLTNLRSLNLSRCYSLKIIVPGALKSLINLEELHMKTFDQWMGKHEIQSESCGATLVELKNLTKLASLEISILHPIILLEDYDLPFENLDKFWIDIGKSGVSGYEGLTTMTLYLEGCDSILWRKWVQKILQKTQFLYLSELSEFKESPRGLCSQEFREVKYLNIEYSPSIKYVADSSNGLPLTAFGKLEHISLENLINLEKICHGPIAPECFSQLKVVRVRQCDQLKYLWRLSDVQGLIQLEEIEVEKCDSMQSIVTYDVGEGIVSTNDRVELRNVRSLRLLELSNMKSFCSKAKIAPEGTSIQVSLPHLESLTMVGLLGLEEILCSERSLKYSNLRLLTIRESKSMSKSIMKLDWILKLPNLESMTIQISPSAEVIFDLEELEVIENVEILSQLTTLTLHRLPNLQCLCNQDVKLQGISILQNLRDLSIYRTGLSFLFSVSMAKCFKKIRSIRVSGCPNMKAVIVDEGRYEGTYDIIEFPQLEYLSIHECCMEKFFSYPCGKKEPVTTTSDSQNANSDSFFDQKVTFPNIIVLQIDGLQCKELWNDQIPTDSFQELQSLVLENCDNLRRIAPPQMWKVLQHCLKNLEVISCHLIEIIYEGHGMDTEGGELRELLLRDLKNMKHIWHSENLPNVPFPNLIKVEAMKCPHLEVLFTTFTAKFLGQIKKLVVESCENMKLIAGHEKGEESTGRTVTMEEVLRLSMLPKFRRSFLPEKYSRDLPWSEDFPSLEVLSINSCGGGADLVLSDGMNLSAGDGGDFITPS